MRNACISNNWLHHVHSMRSLYLFWVGSREILLLGPKREQKMGIPDTYTSNNSCTSQFCTLVPSEFSFRCFFFFLIDFMGKLKRENLLRGLMSVQVCSIAGCTKMQ